ncbi:MAG: PIN domain-containing protein [Deltaproteobacteria bacterium]|nr:PIN domain-containing protein [Deltaproteobacteria bacterium]
MRPRYYLDTSVLGGYFDVEFLEDTRAFWEELRAGRCTAVISTLSLEELVRAPEQVQELLGSLPEGGLETVAITDEVEALADRYVSEGVVAARSRGDALHVAVATLAGVKAIVSWNFKHLVNLRRIELFNGVNMLAGYRTIDIRTPREVTEV